MILYLAMIAVQVIWARRVLEEVEGRMKRLDRQQRAAEADMYKWASDTLAGLRTNSVVKR